MKTSLLFALGLAVAAVVPAQADVFSSQSFDGSPSTSNALPGVNLDVVPGVTSGSNCKEEMVPSYSGNLAGETKATTCQFGNFSITTTGQSQARKYLDLTYGGNPPPWEQGWRP